MDTTKVTTDEVVSDVAEQKAVETETTQTESPQVESSTTGSETDGRVSDDQGTVAESSDEPAGMTEEQRRAFQEQRQEIKRLKEEKESSQSGPSAFDEFRVQAPPAGAPVRVEDFSDPITGETNWTAYNQAQQLREQRIVQAARAEADQAINERLDEERARAKFPELFNDPKTEKLLAAQWFMESKYQGKPVSITAVAEEFARNFKQTVSKAEKVGAERALNEVSEKEKAGLVAETQTSASSQAAVSNEDQADLSYRTRMGDQAAITARISKIPWANK